MVDQDKNVLVLNTAIASDISSFILSQDGIADAAPRVFAANRLKARVFRKLGPSDPSDVSRSEKAWSKFTIMNAHSADWSWKQSLPSDALFDDMLRHELWRITYGYAIGHNYAEASDLGPGANVGSKSNDLYTKLFGCCLTGTAPGLYNRYAHSLLQNPTRLAAEKQRRAIHGPYKIVRGGSVSFVPKDNEIDRVIVTEPILNMLAQKAIASFLELKLKQIYQIDLSLQPDVNKRLARIASMDRKRATVDLQSASDCIALRFVQWGFPPCFARCLLDTRSPYVKHPDGTWHEVHMISGMGNAFTFPLQTLIFATVVKVAYKLLGVVDRIAVFGDDMIVNEEACDMVYHQLERLGFIVNLDKSFRGDNPFRESCGGDYFDGYTVLPVYVRSLKSKSDYNSAFNRLRAWSKFHQIPLFRSLLALRRMIAKPNWQPFGGDVNEALMCTLEQAIRKDAAHLDEAYGVGSSVYEYRVCRKIVNTPSLTLGDNPDALMMYACSGRARPVGRDLLPNILEKEPTFSWKLVTCCTSVWPDVAFMATALYKMQ